MQLQQAVLSLVLMTMVFAVALDLRTSDFVRVFAMPRRIAIGLLPQFVWLPVATWLITLTLELPSATEAAMLLVACCPGGSLSNVVTYWGRGDTAYSVSLSAVATVLAFYTLCRVITASVLLSQGATIDLANPLNRAIAWGLALLSHLLPDLSRFASSAPLAYGAGATDLAYVLTQTALYTVLLGALGLVDFERRSL